MTGYGSSSPDLTYPKGETRAIAFAQRRLQRLRIDERESAAVRRRSGGQCEVPGCGKRAEHVHHMLGGSGRRGRGLSSLAENKAHICSVCHRAVHAKQIRLTWRDGTLQVEG